MSFEDERIVKMTFDNKAFQKNIESTIRALERLDKSMKLDDVSPKAFDNFVDGIDESEQAMNRFDNSVNKVKASFTTLQIVGYTALSELTRFAISTGKKIYDSTLGQIKSGGMTRSLNIEAAKFQIEGLGHTWEEVYDDINYAVQGTAYGLDAAARASSQLLASEIKAGDQMKVSLRGISGLAAVTNSSYEDIADIFTTVAGNGRLMGDQLNRISYRGINAAQTLKDYFNNVKNITVNTEKEIRDMVSKGKVSFMDFAAAMDWAFGKHAKDANKTFTGALSNVKAALSRLGEKFLTPWNEFERRIFVGLIPVINMIGKALDPILPLFNTILDRSASWLESLLGNYNVQKAIVNVVLGIYGWIQNIIGAIAELGFHLPSVKNIGEFLEKITSVLLLNAEQGRKVRNVVKTIIKTLTIGITIIQALIHVLQPIFAPIIGFLKNVDVYTNGVKNKSADIIDKINYIIKYVAVLMRMGIEKGIRFIIAAFKALVVVAKIVVAAIFGIGLVISKIVKVFNIFVKAIKSYSGNIKAFILDIAEAFVKFYNLIREIFTNIGNGMSGFLDTAKSKTKDLWNVINGLTGTKTLTIDINPVISKAKGIGSVVDKNAQNAVSGATKAVDNYAGATSKAADVATNVKKKFGAVGGPFSGKFDAANVVDLTALNQAVGNYAKIGDAARLASKDIADASQSSGDAVSTFAERVQTVFDDIDVDKKDSKFSKKATGLLDGFVERLSGAKEKLDAARAILVEHFTNFYSVLVDAIAVAGVVITVAVTGLAYKIIDAFVGLVSMMPQLVGALNSAAKGFKYQGMGEAFKGLALALLAIGAVVLAVAVISKIADIDAFTKVAKVVMQIMLVATLMGIVVGEIMKVMAIIKILNNLPNARTLLTRITGFTTSLKELFIGLAILLATTMASILVIYNIAQKDGGYDAIYRAAFVVGGLMFAIMAFMLIIGKVIGGLGKNIERTKISFSGITRTTSSSLSGLTEFILSITPLMLVLVGSAAILSKLSDDEFNKTIIAMGVTLAALEVILLTVSALALRIANILSKNKMDIGTLSRGLGFILRQISLLFISISGFMLAFAASAAMLSLVPEAKQEFVMKMMITQGIILGGVLLITGAIVGLLSLSLKSFDPTKSGQLVASLHHVGAIIAEICGAMSALMLTTVASVALVSIIPANKLKSSVAAFGVVMIIVTAAISVIIWQSKSLMRVVGSSGLFSSTTIGLTEKFGVQLAAMIGGIMAMMLTLTASLAVLSTLNPKQMILAGVTLTLMMGAMTHFIKVLLKTLKVTDSLTETMNSQASGKNARTLNSKSTTVKDMTMYMDNTGIMMLEICGAMSVLAISMSAAIKMLGTMDPGQLAQGMIYFLIGFGAIMGATMLLLKIMGSVSKQMGQVNFNKQSFKFIGDLVGMMAMLTGSIVTLMGTMTVLATVIDQLDMSSTILAIVVLTVVFGAMIGIIGMIARMANRMPIIDTSALSKVMLSLTGVLGLLAANVMTLAAVAYVFNKVSLGDIMLAGAMFAEVSAVIAILLASVILLNKNMTVGVNLKGMSVMFADISMMLMQMGGFMAVLGGVSIMLANGKPLATMGLLAEVMTVLGMLIVSASLFKEQFKTAAATLLPLMGVLSILTAVCFTFGLLAVVLGKVDWSNITDNLATMLATFLGIAALMIVSAYAATLAQSGIAAIAMIAGAVTTIVLSIAAMTRIVADAYMNILVAFNFMSQLNWSSISSSATEFKTVISILAEAVGIGLGNVVKAYIIGAGIKALVTGLSILQYINADKLEKGANALTNSLKALQGSEAAIFSVVALVALTAPQLAMAVLVITGVILLVLTLIPIIAQQTAKATSAIAAVSSQIKDNMNTIIDSLKSLKEKVPKDQVLDLLEYAVDLGFLGLTMLIAGITLAVGTAAFMVGALLLVPAILMMQLAITKLTTETDLTAAVAATFDLIVMGITLILAGLWMATAMAIWLPTAAVMLGTFFLMATAFKMIPTVISGALALLGNIDILFVLAGVLVVVGLEMLKASAIIGTAAVMMSPALLLLAGTVGLIFFTVTYLDIFKIVEGIGLLLGVLGGLVLIASVMILAAPVLIIGGALMAVAGILIGVAGSAMLVGMISFMGAILAIWGAVVIISMIPFEDLNGKLGEFALTMLAFIGIGVLILAAAVVLTIAGIFVLASSLLISTAMITFAVTLIVSAALLLAAGAVLNLAFEQLQTLWDSLNVLDMLGLAGSLALFGLLMLIAGILLLPASLLLVADAISLTVVAVLLMVALPLMKKAFDKGISGKAFVQQAALYLVAATLLLGAAGTLLPTGVMLIAFAGMFSTAATMIISTVSSLAAAADSVTGIIDKFKNAGEMVCDGIKEGIEEGASRVESAVEDLAEGDVLGAFKDILGINSPAEEFIKAAANIIAGIAEGLGLDRDEVYDQIVSMGMGMLDTFDGFTDSFTSMGSQLGDAFGGGFSSKGSDIVNSFFGGTLSSFGSLMNGMNTIAIDQQIEAMTRTQNAWAATAKSQIHNQQDWENFDKTDRMYNEKIKELQKQKESLEVQDYQALADQIMKENYGGGGGGSSADIDYSMLDSGTSSALSSAGSGLGKTGSDASSVGGNVGTAITNNTYNFTQNNYSPEPIDRTELYTQTNNQLDTWYKWLRDNG